MVRRPISALAAGRIASVIAVAGIVVAIDVAMEITIVTVIPGTRSDEYAVREPFRPVVAVRGALVGSIVIVPVGACRLRPDLHAETDLRLRFWYRSEQAERCNSRQYLISESLHGSPLRCVHGLKLMTHCLRPVATLMFTRLESGHGAVTTKRKNLLENE